MLFQGPTFRSRGTLGRAGTDHLTMWAELIGLAGMVFRAWTLLGHRFDGNTEHAQKFLTLTSRSGLVRADLKDGLCSRRAGSIEFHCGWCGIGQNIG